MSETPANVDPAELQKFEKSAHRWWDPDGEFKPLHELNPLRAGFIDRHAGLAGRTALDVGCGGGLLSEAMALRGARVTGLDMVDASLKVARLHALESQVQVDYQLTTAEQHAAANPAAYDVVACLEMLEHVPDPGSIIRACAQLVKPGGHVFFSTINRTPKAYALAVVGAEYIMNMLPRGTHDYAAFIRPSELETWCREADLRFAHIAGMSYNPLTRRFSLGDDVDVNYIVHAVAER